MKIEWTEPAIKDLTNIRDFIARDSDYYASRFVEKIIEAVEKLEIFPKIGRKVIEAEKENILELLFHNYRIIYSVESKRILIIAVIHGNRNLDNKELKPWDVV